MGCQDSIPVYSQLHSHLPHLHTVPRSFGDQVNTGLGSVCEKGVWAEPWVPQLFQDGGQGGAWAADELHKHLWGTSSWLQASWDLGRNTHPRNVWSCRELPAKVWAASVVPWGTVGARKAIGELLGMG